MATNKRRYLGKSAQMRLPNPDEALNIGHALHGADDPELRGTNDHALCAHIAEEFLKLRPRPNTPEVPYLDSVKPIVRSYARAITRRKSEYRTEILNAEKDRKEKEQRIGDGRLSAQGLGVLWKFVGPIILGLTGFLFAKLIGNIVPNNIADATGTSVPSIVLGLTFALIGRWISLWLYDRKRTRIVREYEVRRSIAIETYEQGKHDEFVLAWRRLCEAWEQYTGESYPETVSYQMVMKGDMEMRRKSEQHLRQHVKSDWERVTEFSRDIRASLIRVRKKYTRRRKK